MRLKPSAPAVAAFLLAAGAPVGPAAAGVTAEDGTTGATGATGAARTTGVGRATAPGRPTVRGDFDGDGDDDLAVGADFETVSGHVGAGVAHVLDGDDVTGLTGVGSTRLSQAGTAVPSEPEAGDEFGFSLSAADYNGDGRADLAVGAPGESAGSCRGAGAVNVFAGSAGGVTLGGNRIFTQDSPGVGSEAEPGDAFASALSAGDYDADGFADLAVGVSNEAVGTVDGAGAVNTLRGSSAGLTGTGSQLFTQDVGDLGSTPELLDTFGGALASGDFDADGAADLAIGVPAESVGAVNVAGAVNVVYGVVGGGLSATGSQLLVQGSGGVGSTPESRDELGFSVASSDFNGDGRDDLAIGAAFESVGSVRAAGAFHVLRGAGSGLTGVGSQLFTQDSPGVGSTAEPMEAFGFSLGATRSAAG